MDESGVPNILMYSFISYMAFAGLVPGDPPWPRGGDSPGVSPDILPAIYYLTHSDMGFAIRLIPSSRFSWPTPSFSIGAGKATTKSRTAPYFQLASRQQATRAGPARAIGAQQD